MKPPYDHITAVCNNDGEFQVDRKPKTGQKSTSDQPNDIWRQVVCPTCRMWANVILVEEVKI